MTSTSSWGHGRFLTIAMVATTTVGLSVATVGCRGPSTSVPSGGAPTPPEVAPPTLDVVRPGVDPLGAPAPSEPDRSLATTLPPRPFAAPPTSPVRPPTDHGRCMRGRYCELEGFCSQDAEGQCIAADDEDCRPSAACKGGRCTAFEGRCIAANDEDCRGSWACKGYGMCQHDGEEACVATRVEECQASTRCRREGFCTLRDGECVK
ncbi:MAG: hypothetical protein AAF715_13425 [Myxococcota bacterium]